MASNATTVTPRWFLMDVATRFLQQFEGRVRYFEAVPDVPSSLLLRVSVPMLDGYMGSREDAIVLSTAVASELVKCVKDRGAESLGFVKPAAYSVVPQPTVETWDRDAGVHFALSDPGPDVWCVVVVNPPEIPVKKLELTAVATDILHSHA